MPRLQVTLLLGAPVRDIQVRGVHVHHYLPGIALLTLAGAAGVRGSQRVGVHLSGIAHSGTDSAKN